MARRGWLTLLGAILVGGLVWWAWSDAADEVVPPSDNDDLLKDDTWQYKQRPEFDPQRVDRRMLVGGWQVNSSAAVLGLDVAPYHPWKDADLARLRPSYRAARAAAGREFLPSANLIDGKAKQFDDGLVAALERAAARGVGTLPGLLPLLRRWYEPVKGTPAAAHLAAALELAGEPAPAEPGRAELVTAFRRNLVQSKPIGFYTWAPDLEALFRCRRFLQQDHPFTQLEALRPLARALAADPALRADYRKLLKLEAGLCNPPASLTLDDLADRPDATAEQLGQLAQERKVMSGSVAIFPAATSRETVLHQKLFPVGLPPDANLMRELIKALRSGQVNLTPTASSGWYEHQAFALEPLLLPEKAQERNKLMLTKAYKKRLLEAFQALLTKRRETHSRFAKHAAGSSAGVEVPLAPRLRVEPCLTFYLRTARAYAFLGTVLEAAVGEGALKGLRGLREGGDRGVDLGTELAAMRDLFNGLYLIGAENLGFDPDLQPEDAVDLEYCYHQAEKWLVDLGGDPDLAADTRVIVPLYVDPTRQVTRNWATLGVRLVRLKVQYETAPQLRQPGEKEWHRTSKSEAATYLIAVDDFAEIELAGLRMLNRAEFRAACDRYQTKAAIVQALQGR